MTGINYANDAILYTEAKVYIGGESITEGRGLFYSLI